MFEDKEALEAASVVTVVQQKGRHIVHQAMLRATEQMPKMLHHFDTQEGKIEALKYHALHMGVGREMVERVAPRAELMIRELTELTNDEGHASIVTGLWLSKVFREIEKELRAEQE